MRAWVVPAILLLASAISAHAQTSRPPDAELYIISPYNGQKLRGEFTVRFGLRNMGVTYAGDTRPNSGHHHLLIDVKDSVEADAPIPTSKNHLHFGAGQTETKVQLPPGRHTLQLVLGDAEHRPFNPVLASRKVTVTVLPPAPRKRIRRQEAVSR